VVVVVLGVLVALCEEPPQAASESESNSEITECLCMKGEYTRAVWGVTRKLCVRCSVAGAALDEGARVAYTPFRLF
jgi:hypothetical protein